MNESTKRFLVRTAILLIIIVIIVAVALEGR